LLFRSSSIPPTVKVIRILGPNMGVQDALFNLGGEGVLGMLEKDDG